MEGRQAGRLPGEEDSSSWASEPVDQGGSNYRRLGGPQVGALLHSDLSGHGSQFILAFLQQKQL